MLNRALILLFATFVIQDEAAKAPFTVEFQNFSCALLDPTWVLQLDCILHKKRLNPTISVFFETSQQVNEFNVLYHLQVGRKYNSKMTVAHHKFDGCKFIGSFYSNNMIGQFFKRIRSVSNLPKTCPIPGKKLFAIRNYTALAEEYPPFAPAVTFYMSVKIERKGIIFAEIINIGSIVH